MHSWILVIALAAFMLDAALAQPVKLDVSEEDAATDDQLLSLLSGRSLETDSDSLEHLRRTIRAAGDDSSSSSSDESQDKVPKDKERGSSNSGSSEEKHGKPANSVSARRKRAAADDQTLEDLIDQETAAMEYEANVEDIVEPLVEGNHDDYAQGCEVLENNSKEVNNETFLE